MTDRRLAIRSYTKRYQLRTRYWPGVEALATYEAATPSDDLLAVRGEPRTVDTKVLLIIAPSWHARPRGVEVYRNLLLRAVERGRHVHSWRLVLVSNTHRMPEWYLTSDEYMTLP